MAPFSLMGFKSLNILNDYLLEEFGLNSTNSTIHALDIGSHF